MKNLEILLAVVVSAVAVVIIFLLARESASLLFRSIFQTDMNLLMEICESAGGCIMPIMGGWMMRHRPDVDDTPQPGDNDDLWGQLLIIGLFVLGIVVVVAVIAPYIQ